MAGETKFENVQRRTVRFWLPTTPHQADPFVVIVQSSNVVPVSPLLTSTATPPIEAARRIKPLIETLLAEILTAELVEVALIVAVTPSSL
jgi:hypothetical protein